MKTLLFLTVTALSLPGCSTSSGAALPACTWPASLDPSDASDGRCVAARAYLTCTAPGGGGAACISNDLTQCPGSAGETCEDQCHADEYGAACGKVGPGSSPAPP